MKKSITIKFIFIILINKTIYNYDLSFITLKFVIKQQKFLSNHALSLVDEWNTLHF